MLQHNGLLRDTHGEKDVGVNDSTTKKKDTASKRLIRKKVLYYTNLQISAENRSVWRTIRRD